MGFIRCRPWTIPSADVAEAKCGMHYPTSLLPYHNSSPLSQRAKLQGRQEWRPIAVNLGDAKEEATLRR